MIRYCKASDCLILAYTFDCPITIGEALLEHQYMREVGRRNVFHPGKSGERGCIERGIEKGCGRRELGTGLAVA